MQTIPDPLGTFTSKNLNALSKMNLMSDALMTTFFNDITSAQILLENILKDKKLQVKSVTTQLSLNNLYGHSSKLDILAKDTKGTLYNVEIQCATKGASPKRARYYSSLLDVHSLPKGDNYEKLADSYFIFIVESDLFEHNLPIYHFERIMRGESIPCNDGTHIMYVNAKIITQGTLGNVMHDLHCTQASEMRVPYFAKRMQFFKEEREGQIIMCKIMDELINEEKIDIARRMLKGSKLSYDEIANYTGLPMEIVLNLAKQQSA